MTSSIHRPDVSPKALTAEELRDGGYLQEVNRLFFHPLGLALAVAPVPESLIQDGWLTMKVIDVRHDPEGMFFRDLTDIESIRKARRVRDEAAERKPERVRVLQENVAEIIDSEGGEWQIQPIGTKFPSGNVDPD